MANHRETPIEISGQEFREIGHEVIDIISDFLDNIRNKPVTAAESSEQLQKYLGDPSLPENGTSSAELLNRTADLILNHSLLNGHPKFLGYITSSAAPIGALADLLAAAVNPNVGANILSPIATEIEKQTIKWLAEFIGVSTSYGGLLVSGGNMANFTAFLAARTAKSSGNMKEDGIAVESGKMVLYCSKKTHTWIEKATILFGHGSKAIRWIQTDAENKMDNDSLERAIIDDLKKGYKPFMIVGTAGDVSTGAVDDLAAIGALCKAYDLWFHIDGAYGIPAAGLPEFKKLFEGVEAADSIALDPHKWLYNPLEVGCTLVKNPKHLTNTYSSHPEYYNFSSGEEGETHNYYEYGLQNSRGFRALKVWLTFQQVGRNGYVKMIAEDIQLSKLLFVLAKNHPELEALTNSLSITTLRYVPVNYGQESEGEKAYLNTLNEELLNALQKGGELFLSNAIVHEKYCLRACIVNFRTSEKDIEEIIEIIVREGRRNHIKLQGIKSSSIS
jgi:glutamate/tyrosine decarboxylase-like PLP-dependent enzyme